MAHRQVAMALSEKLADRVFTFACRDSARCDLTLCGPRPRSSTEGAASLARRDEVTPRSGALFTAPAAKTRKRDPSRSPYPGPPSRSPEIRPGPPSRSPATCAGGASLVRVCR